VLWTVREPAHVGEVLVSAGDVPLLAWLAAAATVGAAACLLARP
jgi:hypothetical protein